MKVLLCHPTGLMYTEVYLRLEPLGLELAAAAARRAGHDVRVLDMQVFKHEDYLRLLDEWRPDAVGFGVNYLANIPEVIDLAAETRRRLPGVFFFVGGHSASFTAKEVLEHAAGAIDCVVKGEAEEITPRLLDVAREGGGEPALRALPGVVTLEGEGPAAQLIRDLDELTPARDLLAKRGKYFIGVLDPAASIEFSRGCQWDCSFCSAWTFYGRSHRRRDPRAIADELARIREPGVFIVDDVAFVQAEHGYAVANEIGRRGIRKKYYLETRGDVLLRNREVFKEWRRMGLEYMFLGVEAIDEAGLALHRKRVKLSANFEALEVARSLGVMVAINIIADTDWDEARFQAVREWALSVPEIVNVSVNTPYPGTETFLEQGHTLNTRDYRLFDIQHAVTATKLPLDRFYAELVRTQEVLNRKHLGLAALTRTGVIAARLLARGQTNFVRMLWRFKDVFNPGRQLADHARPVKYAMRVPPPRPPGADRRPKELYVLRPPAARAASS
ncbi:MAG TPA: hopanoid C-3 methylase HpnR [Polyangia bacterium]|jgi:hopanoid C-3 methylase HpnR|nr:hopanoid C-3 methylase HpnR [Polyangia bacterium]